MAAEQDSKEMSRGPRLQELQFISGISPRRHILEGALIKRIGGRRDAKTTQILQKIKKSTAIQSRPIGLKKRTEKEEKKL